MLRKYFKVISEIFAKRFGAPPFEPATIRVVEVENAGPLAGSLFLRAFRQPIPEFPRHFLLVCERPGQLPFALGYVHHTQFEDSSLAGGLVVDAWKFRTLTPDEKEAVRQHGGMAEWLMKVSCESARPNQVVFAYIGDAQSLTVNTRVGFRATGHPHLYAFPMLPITIEQLQSLSDRVAAIGPF